VTVWEPPSTRQSKAKKYGRRLMIAYALRDVIFLLLALMIVLMVCGVLSIKEHLEETSLISTHTIIRLGNDPDYGVIRENIVASSVGLTLPPIISVELLRKAGLEMKNITLHNTYRMILCEMYFCKIEAVNKFLVSLNIPRHSQN
jgi:hypothetical protein